MAIDLRGLFYQIMGKSKSIQEEGQEQALEAALDVQGKLLRKDRAKRLRCPNGHPLYKGQRNEDCFDCHLVNVAKLEKARARVQPANRTLSGALLCLKGFHDGQTFPLRLAEDTPLYIGSDPDCDIVLSDEHISRRHLMIVLRQGRTIVRDLNSLHHSALRASGELQWYVLDPEREYWCEDGAHLVLGDVELLYRSIDVQALKLGGEHVLMSREGRNDGRLEPRLEGRTDRLPALEAGTGE